MAKQDPRASEQLAREAVQAIRRAVANPDTVASIAEVYPTDLTRVRVLVDGQLAECLITNPEWSLHIGDRVYVQQLEDHSGRYILRGFVENAGPGAWWRDGVDPDLTTGQGPIPGTRRPHGDADSHWRDLGPNTTSGLLWGHHLAPKPGDETDTSLSERFRVYGGYTDVPIESYGDFIVPGNRIRIVTDPGMMPGPTGFCSAGDSLLQPGVRAGITPFGPGTPPYFIAGRACEGHKPGDPMVNFGVILDTLSFRLFIRYTITQGEDALIFWATNAPALPDKWLAVAVYGGNPVVGVSREILAGVPAYPNGGIGGGSDPASPSSSIWFPFSPDPSMQCRKHFDRCGQLVSTNCIGWSELMIEYKVAPPGSTYDARLTVSDGEGGKTRTYYLRGAFFGGQATTLYAFAGDMKGQLMSPIEVGTTAETMVKYSLARLGPMNKLTGKAGEIFWHRQARAGDPSPSGGEYGADPGDMLGDGLYLFLADDHLVQLQGQTVFNHCGPAPTPAELDEFLPPTQIRFHDQLEELGDDDHLQYHNDARALTWLATRTTTDLPDAPGRRYLTDAEKTTATVAKTTENLSSQIDGTKRTFTTAGTFATGSLDVTLNSLVLRRGIDFYERSARDGFEIDVRTPRTNPRDVLAVAYRPG